MQNDKELETAATQLLRKHGYRADGTPLSEARERQVPYGTLSSNRLESLLAVRGAGGSVVRCCYGRWEPDIAKDFSDNLQTDIARIMEESD